MASDNLKDLEKKISQFKSDTNKEIHDSEKENEDRQTGMRAGSEFMAYLISGGLVGWAFGHFFGNMALWIILMIFAGFGLGIYRASQLMK